MWFISGAYRSSVSSSLSFCVRYSRALIRHTTFFCRHNSRYCENRRLFSPLRHKYSIGTVDVVIVFPLPYPSSDLIKFIPRQGNLHWNPMNRYPTNEIIRHWLWLHAFDGWSCDAIELLATFLLSLDCLRSNGLNYDILWFFSAWYSHGIGDCS